MRTEGVAASTELDNEPQAPRTPNRSQLVAEPSLPIQSRKLRKSELDLSHNKSLQACHI